MSNDLDTELKMQTGCISEVVYVVKDENKEATAGNEKG
jgi:hypothetical protein